MHADYIANPLYGNNPFIEALPPMLSGKDLIRALAVIPPYSDSDRDRSTGERLQLLSSLYEFYQPLSIARHRASLIILTKLLYNAQKQAILDGREKLDLEVFGSAFLRNLGMVSEYISELSTKPVVKRQSKTTPEVSVGSAAPSKIVGNDIRVLIKKAKKNGESPVWVKKLRQVSCIQRKLPPLPMD